MLSLRPGEIKSMRLGISWDIHKRQSTETRTNLQCQLQTALLQVADLQATQNNRKIHHFE